MRKNFIRIIISSVLFFTGIIINAIIDFPCLIILLFILSYIIVGYDVVIKAIKNICRGKVFDENFLMMIATFGAIVIKEYPEATAVMLFYQIGELFQKYAVNKSRRSIASLMEIRPDYANVLRNGAVIQITPDEVSIGETIIVRVGEKIPLDGTVTDGTSIIDTSALTGESLPREISTGDAVLSGCINLQGVISIIVTKNFEESTVNKILELVENASSRKSKSENFISRFAAVYTPIVVIIAVLLAAIPPAFFRQDLILWGYRALNFLVVSCPCALVISVPLSFFGGIGGSSRSGILVKGSNYLEALAKCDTMVFDKTGTLTEGTFEVSNISTSLLDEGEILRAAAYAEYYSNHPISVSIKKAYGKDIDETKINSVEEFAGYGVKAIVDNKKIHVGNYKLMQKLNVKTNEAAALDTIVYVAIDDQYVGCIEISDSIKKDVKNTIAKLKKNNIKNFMILTGDTEKVAKKVATELGINKVYADLLPNDKVNKFENILDDHKGKGKIAFIGDGINDAPVLARADIGIAMGALGSDAAIEAADIVIMDDDISKILKAIKIARKTLAISNQNIVFAISIKILVLFFSAIGAASMWMAVFADVGVAVIAILNSLRTLKKID